uniref:Uncharacterized protein n=1 Tax=Plectus sambesii TaxID=2011161 RepID=A0A914XQ56_9BILA
MGGPAMRFSCDEAKAQSIGASGQAQTPDSHPPTSWHWRYWMADGDFRTRRRMKRAAATNCPSCRRRPPPSPLKPIDNADRPVRRRALFRSPRCQLLQPLLIATTVGRRTNACDAMRRRRKADVAVFERKSLVGDFGRGLSQEILIAKQ